MAFEDTFKSAKVRIACSERLTWSYACYRMLTIDDLNHQKY